MMTCRLLCALLVLGLCCCPSVYATTTGEDKTEKENVPKVDEPKQVTDPPSRTPSPPENKEECRGPEQSHTTGAITKTPQSQNTSNNTQGQDGGKSNEQTEHTNTVTANEQKKAAAPTTTTTTTKAPTTTTTRAPSHLREIDGSLSSSAWVCATLLLAASALAYTTLG
ncbi:putative mucin TcMUCII [Trypanosoma cruzi]|uniref:Mucin TcMUCII, putative n=2 Tax=Trypanosoma cruzi TaxID=5693 RepID=Q4DBI3_TRYCC|nr:mucin TcMUCII, putative [Trypanosoma cruzi]EAN89887.1 mucin TcMUCII, putative [Trypanosoma cruzi]PWV09804.1 putative mucin TcMUCII [Trypanosoma cruzi]|eukprot:XP_811738.1 mucin TcMUCII [Trypanosoma cruzi strain CL Brener]